MINPVKDEQAKGTDRPEPKGVQLVASFHSGSTRTGALPGKSWGLTHRVRQVEHGKPVSLPYKGQADRKERCGRCG
jgi:hypothetical protein